MNLKRNLELLNIAEAVIDYGELFIMIVTSLCEPGSGLW